MVKKRGFWHRGGPVLTLALLFLLFAALAIIGVDRSAVAAASTPPAAGQQPLKPPPDDQTGGTQNPFTARPAEAPFGADVRVITDTTTQSHNEPSIAVNPANRDNLVAGSNDYREGGSNNIAAYYYVSDDGGQTWANGKLPGLATPPVIQGDMAVAFGPNNWVYYNFLNFVRTGSNSQEGVWASASSDGGHHWGNPVLVADGFSQYSVDKEYIIADNSNSAYRGNVYSCWTNFGSPTGIHFNRSTNNGTSWSSPATYIGTGNDQGCDPAVGPNGEVYVAFSGNSGGNAIVLNKSTNGGVSFTGPTRISGLVDIGSPPGGYRASSFPSIAANPTNGTLHVVWPAVNGSDPADIMYSRSINGGSTWSTPIKLNDDSGSHWQFMPWIDVSPTGVVGVSWNDTRSDAANRNYDEYYIQSTDDGLTWTRNYRVSTVTSTPPTINGNFIGDYTGIIMDDMYVHPIWCDTREGNTVIYTNRALISAFGGGTTTPTPTPAPPTNTSTSTATNTPAPPTNTPTSTATNTPAPPTSTPTNTPAPPTSTPTLTPTDCPNPFVDINGNTFYTAIHYLYCRGVVNGIDPSHFGPSGTATRAQFAKVVVLGFGIAPYTPSMPDFTDVSSGYFAFAYIEAGFHAGILNGFDPATCAANGVTYPCYLPNLAITRGQITKLVVLAAHYALVTPLGGGQTYTDVPPTNPFYLFVETAHYKGVVNGFPDGSFKPNQSVQRDQMCQIVYKGIITP